jgi:uncharacterized protein DUF4242
MSHRRRAGTVLVSHLNDPKETTMELYAILRRNGWQSAADLEQAAARSTQVGDEEMADDVRWIRSYVLGEADGTVGTVCLYEASSPEAIRKHAERADLPVDEIIPVADTVIVRPDPAPVTG